jgi:F0F1-type ATP synthase assembly protein I
MALVPSADKLDDTSTDVGAGLTDKVAWSITSYLIAGALMGAFAGYGLDRLFDTHFIVGIGLVVGKALTLYYVWLRYGTH